LEYPHIFDIHPHSIVATSHSKDLALPGERIGYIAIHPDYTARQELVDGLTFSTRVLGFVNAPALIQRIVANLQDVTIDVAEYQSKRDSLYNNLVEMGYDVVRPQGAFYMFPKSPIEDDVAFVAELQQKGVLVVPGRGFGAPGYFRIAYCVDESTLQGAIPGLHSAIQNHL
jgi:aspartate aminotransferase